MKGLDYSTLPGSVPDGFDPERLTDQKLLELSNQIPLYWVRGPNGERLHFTTMEDFPYGGLSQASVCRTEIRYRIAEGTFNKALLNKEQK